VKPNAAIALGAALLLAACNTTAPDAAKDGGGNPVGKLFSGLFDNKKDPAIPGMPAASTGIALTEPVKTDPEPGHGGGAGKASTAQPPSTGPRASQEEIKSMLIRTDPAACSATADASMEDTLAIYGKLAYGIGADLLGTRVQDNNAALQAKLDELKPAMRTLARNTNWMPHATERLFGNQIYAYNKFDAYVPRRGAQKKLVEQVIAPLFEDFKRYAHDDLKSEFDFELRLYQHESTTPSMIAGGILLVPSGMLNALSAVEKPELLIAFMFAHEFSHALRRHKTKMLQMSLVDSMMLAGEFKQIVNTERGSLGRLKGDVSKLFHFTDTSAKSLIAQSCRAHNWLPLMEQGQEFEADVCGALLLHRIGQVRQQVYRPVDGYAQYLKSGLAGPAAANSKTIKPVATKAAGGETGSCFVSADHPNSDDRMSNLQSYSVTLERDAVSQPTDKARDSTKPPQQVDRKKRQR
jgi:Peptidase family M48